MTVGKIPETLEEKIADVLMNYGVSYKNKEAVGIIMALINEEVKGSEVEGLL